MSECNNCDKYDYQTHSCPIFCDVIRNTLDDVRADEMARMLAPYDVESIEELIQNVRAKTVESVIEDIIPTLCEWDVDEEVIENCKGILEQMKGDKE